MESTDGNPVSHAPPPRRRRLIRAFIAVFLLVQLLVPLRYYLRSAPPNEPRDERFAWRMFSSEGSQKVRLVVYETVEEGDQLVQRRIASSIIESWGPLMSERADLAHRFVRWWVQRPGVRRVSLELSRTGADGVTAEPYRLWIDRGMPQAQRGAPPNPTTEATP